MLKEKIFYKDELPINVTTGNITEHPIHFHEDMEIVFVLEGSINLKDGYYSYLLKQGDVFVINDREMHSLSRTDENNMVMILHLSLAYFSRYYEDLKNDYFVIDNDDGKDENLDVLRNLMARIMIEILQKGYGYEQKVIESTHNLITSLMSNFIVCSVEEETGNGKSKGSNRILVSRLIRITNYMHENYSRKLTLNEIAEKEDLSIFYLSHVIKEATDLSFQDLLSYIRVEESEKLLLGTNKKIGAIAEEVGFSAVRYYTKHFITWYGMHPNEYRKKYAGKQQSRESSAVLKLSTPAQIEDAIRKIVKGAYSEYVETLKQPPVIIEADIRKVSHEQANTIPVLETLENLKIKSILEEPYDMLMNLDERVIAVGNNYMVTTANAADGSTDNLSILLYSLDEDVQKYLNETRADGEDEELVMKYDGQNEFLIRCSGLSGNYRVLRYSLNKEIIAIKMARTNKFMSGREKLSHSILTEPDISISTFTSTNIMSIRSVFQGIGTELILIDKIEG